MLASRTLTTHFETNIGALLQAFALNKFLRDSLGIDARIIDYTPEVYPQFRRPFLRRGSGLLHRPLSESLSMLRLVRRCESFRRHHMCRTERVRSAGEIADVLQECDIAIAGSDQLWNTHFPYGNDPAYYLAYAGNAVRVSYAVSAGAGSARTDMPASLRQHLMNIDHLSVRDRFTAQWVAAMIGRVPEIVCDPTLLLQSDDYPRGETTVAGSYILCYLFGRKHSHEHGQFVRYYQSVLKLPTISVSTDTFYQGVQTHPFADQMIVDAGPIEFLELLRHSKMVITDSFHCCIFCALFGIPFVAFDEYETGRSLRLRELLADLGIANRLARQDQLASGADALVTSPASKDLSERLSQLRAHAVQFLEKSICGARRQ